MGIGDDIKPKKIYQYNSKKSTPIYHKEQEKEEKQKSQIEQQKEEQIENDGGWDREEELEELQDDFFEHSSKGKTKEKSVNKIRPSYGKLFSVFAILALIVIILYQNFDLIVDYIYPPTEESNTTENIDNYYEGSAETTTKATDNSEDTAQTETAAIDETKSIDKESIKIKLLNGNGITGSAAKVKSILLDDGFTIDYVGNAKKFSYLKTYIYYSSDKEKEADLIAASLSDRSCVKEKEDTVTGSYDIVIVVGKN